MEKETGKSNVFTIGALEKRDIAHLIPVVRTWVRKDDRVIEEEFEAILERFKESLKRENGDTYLVVRDPGGRAVGIMGFAEVAPNLASWRSSPGNRAAGLAAVFLSPDIRGEGLGRSLLMALFDGARKGGWTEMIWTSNHRYRETAWRFYTKMAGEPVGTIEGFFEQGVTTPVWKKGL